MMIEYSSTSIILLQARKHNSLLHLSVLEQQLQQLRVGAGELFELHLRTPHRRIPRLLPFPLRQILRPPHHPRQMPPQTPVLHPHHPHHARRHIVAVVRVSNIIQAWLRELALDEIEQRLAGSGHGFGSDPEHRRDFGLEYRVIAGDETRGDWFVEEGETDVGGEDAVRGAAQSDGRGGFVELDNAIVGCDLGRWFLWSKSSGSSSSGRSDGGGSSKTVPHFVKERSGGG